MLLVKTMKKANWLLEADIFEDNSDKLVKIIKDKGMKVHVLKYVPFDDDLAKRCLKIYDSGECVIFYGSLNFGRKLMRGTHWTPGVYLKNKEYECTSYYPILQNMLLHYSDYLMLPYSDLVNKKNRIFSEWFGYSHDVDGAKAVFIRPNSGQKEFTGMIAQAYGFEDAVKLAGFYNVDPDMLVLVSSVKNIMQEWRFVVVNGKVISGSLYRDWSKPGKHSKSTSNDYVLSHSHSLWEECTDPEAWNTAQKCADKYNPDTCWTIDIALTDYGTYAILEIGCFSCAGMYGNNLGIVVDAVSEAAVKDWEEIWGKEEDK